jgi:hypothetical protein
MRDIVAIKGLERTLSIELQFEEVCGFYPIFLYDFFIHFRVYLWDYLQI